MTGVVWVTEGASRTQPASGRDDAVHTHTHTLFLGVFLTAYVTECVCVRQLQEVLIGISVCVCGSVYLGVSLLYSLTSCPLCVLRLSSILSFFL